MVSYYFDSDVVVKRYFREAGHYWVQTECDSPSTTVYISELALTEVVIVLHKKAKQNRTFRPFRDLVIAAFRQDAASGSYHIRRLTPVIFARAGDLGRSHGISSQDAIQLACALEQASEARSIGADVPVFVSGDKDLRRFAAQEGLAQIINPHDNALPSELVQRKFSWRERAGKWCDSLHARCKRLLRR